MSAHLFPDGSSFPSPGLGTWKIPEDLTPQIVHEAIEIGYRHLDCACDYGNESFVGQGIKSALDAGLCSRDDLWVTSKLWNTYHEPQRVRAACEKSLADLGLDYLDLYLVHFPIALEFIPFDEMYPPGWTAGKDAMSPIKVPYSDTWKAMEELVDAGLVMRIGVCNLTTSSLRDVLSYARIKPAVHQIELHPYLTQNAMVRYCQEEDIAITAFSPFGADSYLPLDMAGENERVLTNPVLLKIAEAHERTPAQVALCWAMQRGTIPIPKTQSSQHLRENLDLFEFTLSEEELAAITALDQHRRFNDPAVFGENVFNTFYPIFD